MNAKRLIQYAEEEYSRIKADLGYDELAVLHGEEDKIAIILCSTQDDFEKVTKGNMPEWGIGCALPGRIIVIKSPRLVRRNINLRQLVAHEITHIMLQDIEIPRWFNEGIAMYESHEWKFGNSITLSFANLTNSIIPLSSLERRFPEDERGARLAYVESFSAIAYIIQEFGRDGLKDLMKDLRGKNSFEHALVSSFGIDHKEFKKEWYIWARNTYNGLYILIRNFFPWAFILALFFVVFFISLKRRRKKYKEFDSSECNTENFESEDKLNFQ